MTTEPLQVSQGERVTWTRTLDDYDATEYTLVYRFRGQGEGFDVTCTADGTDFAAVLAVGTNQAVTAYQWQAWLTEIADSTNTFIIDSGTIEVLRGFVADATKPVDLRTPAKKCLDSIDEALASAGSDIAEYEISTPAGSRRVKRRTDLLDLRKYWASVVANEVAREKARRTGVFGQVIGVRMYDS